MNCFSYDNAVKKKIKCTVCGKEFSTTHPHRKTCSVECSMMQKQRTMKEANKDNNRYYSRVRKSK